MECGFSEPTLFWLRLEGHGAVNYKRTGLPSFLEAMNLYPFIGNELRNVLDVIDYTRMFDR